MTNQRHPLHTACNAAYLGFLALSLACGSGELPRLQTSGAEDSIGEDRSSETILSTEPTRGYHLANAQQILAGLTRQSLAPQDAVIDVQLVPGGFTYQKGHGASQSTLPCAAQGKISAADLDEAALTKLTANVRLLLRDLPVPVSITQKPTAGATKIVLGGSYEQLGCPDSVAAPVVATTFDRYNLRAADVAFVFSDVVRNTDDLPMYVAVAIAHSMGIEAVPDWKTGTAQFITETHLSLQSSSGAGAGLSYLPAGLASAPGLDVISSLGQLLAGLQADQLADISGILPQVAQLIPGGLGAAPNFGGLNGLADLMTVLGMASQAAAKQAPAGAPTDLTSLLSGFLNPSQLQQSGATDLASLAVVAGLAATGNPAGIAAAIGILSQMFAGAAANNGNPKSAALTALPDFSKLLSIGTLGDPQALLATIMSQAQLINGNFSGQQAAALLTFLRLGALQGLQQQLGNLSSI